MGILNLHKFLERCSSKTSLATLRGQVVGVDAMCWLHRGSIASAWELLTGRDTDKFLRFFVKMLVLCNMCGVKPIIVFDGASLPAKAKEENERRERRALNTARAKAEIEEKKISSFGQVDPKLRSMIVQSVSITSDMITRTMSVLRRLNVDFIVAPYEADAQLAFMYKQGIISGVVSEDSDLIAFGCHRLLSKLDLNGEFVDVRLDWAFRGADLENKPSNLGELGKLEKWTESMFVDLCILSGSDYKFGKITGIGIKKAFALLNRFRSIDSIVQDVGYSKKWSRDEIERFLSEFHFAKIAFLKHRVFDIKTCRCITISEDDESGWKVPDNVTLTIDDIIGPQIDEITSKQIMTGEINAKTHEKRYFLDKLPPGVLGVYTTSLRDKENRDSIDTKANSQELRNREASAYELLEQQIVADFEKNKRTESSIQETKQNYLNKLHEMILAKPLPKDDEFGEIEKLLEEEWQGMDDGSTIDLSLDDDVEEPLQQKPILLTSPPPPSQPAKVRNPFAKLVPMEDTRKKMRLSLPSAVTAAPTKRTSTGGNLIEFLGKDPLPQHSIGATTNFVTNRDITSKTSNSKFINRR